MGNNWLKAAFNKLAHQSSESESKDYEVIEGTVFMTAEQSAKWIEDHGVQRNPEMEALAASSMEDHMREREKRFESGTLGEGEEWIKTISASVTPDTSKLNHAHAVRRVGKE
jgi:hypothetical protein